MTAADLRKRYLIDTPLGQAALVFKPSDLRSRKPIYFLIHGAFRRAFDLDPWPDRLPSMSVVLERCLPTVRLRA